MLADIDQLITIAGMVIRTSNIMPEMREAFFKCIVCAYVTSVEIERGRIAEPTLCTNCNTNHCFTLIHNRSQFTDKQMVKLQESPGECIEGTRNSHVALVVTLERCCFVNTGVTELGVQGRKTILLWIRAVFFSALQL
jgi:DNA replication licensing factor MCM4